MTWTTRTPPRPGTRQARPDAVFLLACCGVVATAFFLGAGWLGVTVFGFPIGLWLIAAACLLDWLLGRREQEMHLVKPDLIHPDTVPQAPPGPHARPSPARSRALALGRRAAHAAEVIGGALNIHLPEPVLGVHDRLPWPTSPWRVGVCLPDEVARMIEGSEGNHDIEWVAVPRPIPDRQACSRFGLDAVLRVDDLGEMVIRTAESTSGSTRSAAWTDWAAPQPLAYASVFPLRIDPLRVTLGDPSQLTPSDCPLLRLMLEAVICQSRTGPRLGFSDRLRGRRPVEAAEGAMLALADLVGDTPLLRSTPMHAAAARAVGAFLATSESDIAVDRRRRGIESASTLLADEPQALLRVVAVRSAAGDDEGMLAAAEAAVGLIRSAQLVGVSDPAPFVQSELDHSKPDDMTLGRVAAGLCLLCALTTDGELEYLREDLADDLRHTEWLLEREDDQRMLIELLRQLGAGEMVTTSQAA